MSTLRVNRITDLNELSGRVVQSKVYEIGTVSTGSTTLPTDNTVPQITEGFQVLTLSFTPRNANNYLKINVLVHASFAGAASNLAAALFQGSTASAIAVGHVTMPTTNYVVQIALTKYIAASDVDSRTYTVRVGSNDAGTVTINGSASTQRFGGVLMSSITIDEIEV